MNSPTLTITPQAQRRFILGMQGLYPGRRWQGKEGAAQAIHEGVVVQVDPLSILARSHDLVLHSRVLGYTPALLDELLYRERQFFDYGAVVRLQPMADLPYWRVVMARRGKGLAHLGEENQDAVDEVLAALRERGPLTNRDFKAPPGKRQYWHAAKTTAQALYYLWMKGEVMTHSRRGFERCYDLAERIVPPGCGGAASPDEAEDFFALRALRELGLSSMREWRAWWTGIITRKASMDEAQQRLDALVESGRAATVHLAGEAKDPIRYLLSEDLPLLEAVQADRIPDAWQPLGPDTTQEAVFLAPLDIVSARGRALPLFGFEYKWEVYTPVAQRRWGYYVLPVLVGDRLVARFDAKVEKASRGAVGKRTGGDHRTLSILGFWWEEAPDDEQRAALSAGFERFAAFLGAGEITFASE